MLRMFNALLVMLVALSLNACIVHVDDDEAQPGWYERQRDNRARIQQLALGVSADEVYHQLGPADMTEAFVLDDVEYRILRYRTQRRHGDGETSRDETTPLLFENGRLVGWGERAVQHTLQERGAGGEAVH